MDLWRTPRSRRADAPPAHAYTLFSLPRLLAPNAVAWGTAGLASGVLLLFVLGVFGVALMARGQEVEEARVTSGLVEYGITRTLESAESLLLTVASTVAQDGEDGAPGPIVHDWPDIQGVVTRSIRFVPSIRQVLVVNRDSEILMDTSGRDVGRRLDRGALGIPSPPTDPAGTSALFRGIAIGTLTQGRFLPVVGVSADPSARATVPMSLWASPQFLVVVAMNPGSVKRILHHAVNGPVRQVALTTLDGTPILTVGTSHTPPPDAFRTTVPTVVSSGAELGTVSVTGGQQIVALSSHFPVAVVAHLSNLEHLLNWLRENVVLLFWGAVTAVGVVVAGHLLMRETVQRLRLENRLALVSLTEAVFAHSAEAMLIVDRKRRVLAANPAFQSATGHAPDAVIGTPLAGLVSPAPELDSPDMSETVRRTLPYWHLQAREGAPRAVEYREAPLSPDATIITLNDITERIASERALQAAVQRAELASKAKSEFLASMSHELRTPLNAILGFSEVMREGVFGPVGGPRYEEYLQDIQASGIHLRDVINDLLDLAKIEAGSLDLDPEDIHVADEIRTCCRLVGKRAQDHGLTLTDAVPEDLPTLNTDRQVFRQLMFNLLSNAIKFTPTGGRITVDCAVSSNQGLAVSVADTGLGISAADQKRIFDAYERAVNTETRNIQGSGLGLSLVKAMMEVQGGAVSVQSRPGEGSVFTLWFPPTRLGPAAS
ncbi:PAS domain S-box protein [Roseospira marina]|uniref:histidine kinase n=1 Tax=Roseospira marina TaxID=140057 RepID=A0A5M6IGS2_9PROT|nr:PAS domain-containing sensor histidine kinase [Roseospira marina]KAA5607501.1 PAS domain S-box protein [Roseospira marina]MBB4312317.1 PAS domain S-box-containing protein [Roseospira marina]MBB5085667.1 PAS domain S-box-containing protein [Roseospira marina]